MDPAEVDVEISNALVSYQDTTHINVLKLNREMQNNLQTVRAQLELALKQLDRRFRINQHLMTQMLANSKYPNGLGKNGANVIGTTFYFKGSVFFKDANCRSCPNNQDYEYRTKVEHEMFPMDLELCGRHVWSMQDKLGIVQGVKQQILDYINEQHNRKTKRTELGKRIALHSDKLVELLPKVENTSFEIDWHEICVNHVNHRHSPTSCKGMWQLYLYPKLKKDEWTENENSRLVNIAQQFNCTNWPEISKEMGNRSDYQCFVQFYTRLYVRHKNFAKRWTKNDDTALLECIKNNTANGIINWNLVAARFPQKDKKSLHGRYAYSLHPAISHEPFTDEEDVLLLAAIKEYGSTFSRIPRTIFPNRSLTQLRSRYNNVLLVRKSQHPWTLEDDQKLLNFVSEHGSANWLRCSGIFDGRHSRTSCRTRYLVIKRYFAEKPNVTLSQLPRLKVKRSRSGLNVNTENWEEKVTELQMESFINEIREADETESVILQKEELVDDFGMSFDQCCFEITELDPAHEEIVYTENNNGDVDIKPVVNKKLIKKKQITKRCVAERPSRKRKKEIDAIELKVDEDEDQEFINITPKKKKRKKAAPKKKERITEDETEIEEVSATKTKRIQTMKPIFIDKTEFLKKLEEKKQIHKSLEENVSLETVNNKNATRKGKGPKIV